MAYEIVARLRQRGEHTILHRLADAVMPGDRKRGKLHQVFVSSFDAREIYSEAMLHYKMDYIHHNLVSGKWHLVEDFAKYKHSSAAYYEFGKACSFPIAHYTEILYGENAKM